MGPGGGGMACGLREHEVVHAGQLFGFGAFGQRLKQLETEGAGFIEGEFLKKVQRLIEWSGQVACEVGFEESVKERGVLRQAGFEQE